jgi:hypothetical protein
MLHNISWGSYWYALTISLLLYYAFILRRYFRQDVFQYLAHKKLLLFPTHGAADSNKQQPVNLNVQLSEDSAPAKTPQKWDNYQAAFEDLLDELDAYFEQAKERNIERAELLSSYAQIIRKYPSFHNAPTGDFICCAIVHKSKVMLGIELSMEEIDQLVAGGIPRS